MPEERYGRIIDMKRQLIAGFLGLAGGLGLILSAQAETITIRLADTFPAGHYISERMTKIFMAKAGELSNGEIAFKYFTAGQLGKIPEMLDLVENKVVDMAYVPPSGYADRIPLMGVSELPGFFTKSSIGTPAFLALLDGRFAKSEFSKYGVSPVFGAVLPQYQIAAAGEPIDGEDDFKGVRLRTPGGVLELAANELGALAVPMGGPEMYTAFQRGTVDATLNAYGSMQSYKLNEVLKSVSTNGSFGSFAMTYVIDDAFFASLSPEHRKALKEAGRHAALTFANWVDANEQSVAEKFKSAGIVTYEIPDAVAQGWNKKLLTVADRWSERLLSRGLPGVEVVAEWTAAVEASRK